MDVRCEKCQTEYELDESRLKPGGVTVKCTTCGHMFKIRKRSPTQSGIAVTKTAAAASRPAPSRPSEQPAAARHEAVPAAAARADSRPQPRGPEARSEARTVPERRPEPRADRQSDARTDPRASVPQDVTEVRGTGPSMPPANAEGDRTWIIRLENGESRTCRDLGTLQQWIVTGMVSRESMISRSGKTWKRLGDIAELTNFFTVADEATQARAARDGRRHDFDEDTRPTGPLPQPAERRTALGAAAAPVPAQGRAAAAPARLAAAPLAAAPAQPALARAPAPAPLPAPPGPLPTAPPVRLAAPTPPPDGAPAGSMAERKTGGWAIEGVPPSFDGDEGEAAGPRRGAVRPSDSAGQSFGGMVRPIPTDDAAFTSGGLGPHVDPTMDFDDEEPPRRRSAGVWIALGSLVVIGGAAAAIYFLVLKPKADRERDRIAVIDAAAPTIATATDAGLATPELIDAAAATSSALVDEARVQLGRDAATGLIAAGKALADGGGDAAPALAMRARLLTAQAQIVNDEADLADAATADKIRRDGKQLVLDALTLAQKALKAAAADADANLAMADVLRLQGKPAVEVRRYLTQAKGDAVVQREVALVGALLDLRDKQAAKAKDALVKLDTGDGALEKTGDVRVRWRLALIANAAKQPDAARAAVEAVLAAQPDHAGARALQAKVAAVATDDPMPPEVGSGSGSEAGSGSAAGSGSGSGSGAGSGSSAVVRPPGDGGGSTPSGSYDSLLAKANKLAEVNCGQAIPYYQKALEAKPNSVEALTGMGYCHLDAKQFSSAHSKFRAALGISARYERALWGMAELYQQQGRAELAVEAYKAYLEVYPNSVAAKRQLERLEGKASGKPTPPEDNPGGDTTPPPPPPPSDPTPPPARPDLPPSEPQ